MIQRVIKLSPTPSQTRNIPLIMQRKKWTLESSTDATFLPDAPSSSAKMSFKLPSPVFNPEVELRWK
jgi:hypothetical protein